MGILYVSDLDGTLLNTSASLSPYTIKTINCLVEKGMLFTYATARSLSSASVAAKGLNPKIPVIVYNGAYIMEPATGNILASESFTKEERSYVERKLSGYGVSPVVYSFIKGRECVSWNLLQGFAAPPSPPQKIGSESAGTPPQYRFGGGSPGASALLAKRAGVSGNSGEGMPPPPGSGVVTHG